MVLSQQQVINKFVVNFLTAQKVSPETIELWQDKTTQKRLKTTIKKQKINHPKGVKGVYIHFCKDEREAIIAANPSMPIKEVTCMLGTRWSEFKKSEDLIDKARMDEYVRLFTEDQERYRKEKNELEPYIPKKPRAIDTAYRAFCAEERGKKPITMVELNKKWEIVKKDPELVEKYKEIASLNMVPKA